MGTAILLGPTHISHKIVKKGVAKFTATMFDVHFMNFYLLFLLDRVFVTVLDGVFLTLFAGDLLGHFDRDIDAVFLGNVHAMLLGDLFLHVITFLALYLVTLLPWNLLWVLFEQKSGQCIQSLSILF